MRLLYYSIPSFAYDFSNKESQTWDSLHLIPKSSSIGNNLDFVGRLGVNIPTNPVLEDSPYFFTPPIGRALLGRCGSISCGEMDDCFGV